MQECESSRPPDSEKASSTPDQPAYLYNPSNVASTTSLPSTAAPQGESIKKQLPLLQHCNPSGRGCPKDLDWWIVHATGSNGKPIKLPKAERVMESDVSTTGWGASCQGFQTGGPWDQKEAQMHINWLELKAAFLAFERFAAKWTNVHVLLILDNRTVIALINKKGSPHSKPLSDLAVQLWEWCLTRGGITVRAKHIPGVENVRDPSDWRMDSKVFQQIFNQWGPLQVDLFAVRHNAQLPQYFSFKPDPRAVVVDAFTQNWSCMPSRLF